MIALAAHLAQIGELPVLEPLRVGLRTIQQPGDLRRRQQRVVFGLAVPPAARRARRRCPAAS